jgi:hypothetical protein
VVDEKRKGRKMKRDGKEGGRKNQITRKRREKLKKRCIGANRVKSLEELHHKSLSAAAESHHDAEVVTWRCKGDEVHNPVSSQSTHMTTLHLFRVCYANVADEGDGLQLWRVAVNMLNEQPEMLDEDHSLQKLL